jgi:aminomethyltransferase
MGVSEMTRFGMEEEDFRALAGLIHDVVISNSNVTDQVKALRGRFREIRFCFNGDEYADVIQRLHGLL